MVSSQENPNRPPLMSPESQDPSLFRVGLANMQDSMKGPKGQVALALLQQQLGKIGQSFAPVPFGHQQTPLDQYGNPIL